MLLSFQVKSLPPVVLFTPVQPAAAALAGLLKLCNSPEAGSANQHGVAADGKAQAVSFKATRPRTLVLLCVLCG